MADTINTNSFFNQPEGEGGGISSVQVLAQNAFDIATNVRTQFNNFVQTFDQYKLDAGESDRLISNTVSDLDIQIDEINKSFEKTIKDFNDKFKEIEDDIGGQDDKIKGLEITVDKVTETVKQIQESQKAAAEKAADDAFRAQDAAQKAGDKKDGGVAAGGLGGLASMMGVGDKGSGGGDDKKKEPGNFWMNPLMWGLMGAGALHGMGAGIKRGIGGAADFLTGGLFDFDKQSGGGGLRKIGGGLKNMFGGKKKEEDVETEVDNLESRVDALESGDPSPKDSKKTVTRTVTKRKVKPHYFDMKTGKAYIDGEEVPLELYKEFKSMSPEEQLNDPRFSTGDPISPTEDTDEKGLEPKGEEGEKKEKGLFGGFFGGLFAKGDKGKEKIEETGTGKDGEGKDKEGKMTPYEFIQENGLEIEDLEDGIERHIHVYNPEIQDENGNYQGVRISGTYKQKDEVSTKQFINNHEAFKIQKLRKYAKDHRGGGLKGKLAGAADFMTGGMFDFDNKNRKGAPKDFGIRRMAGGIADTMTGGLTDFDKRGKGNLQVNPLFGGKDKAWGAADEQAKRGEKQSGMGIKRGIGGALDFATLGTFDFDKQNKKDAPKGWGLKRIAGGLADSATMGLTDFDKRGAGLLQFDAISGGRSTSKKTDKKIKTSGKVDKNLTIGKNKYDLSKLMGGLSREEFDKLPDFERNLILSKQRQYGSQNSGEMNKKVMKGDFDISSVPSGSGKDFQQLSQPPEGDGTPEVLPIQTVAGDNTASNIINQMAADKGDFSTDDDTADGTECTIECINMMKANSTRLIKF